MPRSPTWDESAQAVHTREAKRTLAEYVWSLRCARWSHDLCMAIYRGGPMRETPDLFTAEDVPKNGRRVHLVEAGIAARAIVRTAKEQEDPREHGFISRQTRTSGRKRRRREPPPPSRFGYGFDPA